MQIGVLIWLQSLLAELGIKLRKPPHAFCDNQSAISMSANPVLHSKTKHLELDLHFVRKKVQQGDAIQI